MEHPKLSHAASARGADMGRRDVIIEKDAPIKFHLYRMPLTDGYDTGSAYWGEGSAKSGQMYHAYGDGPEFKNEMFIRATSRSKAREQVLAVFKQATFSR